jgi:hypothetical protein
MSVRLPVFVLFCEYAAALQRAEPPSKGSNQLRKNIKKLKKRPRHNKDL